MTTRTFPRRRHPLRQPRQLAPYLLQHAEQLLLPRPFVLFGALQACERGLDLRCEVMSRGGEGRGGRGAGEVLQTMEDEVERALQRGVDLGSEDSARQLGEDIALGHTGRFR